MKELTFSNVYQEIPEYNIVNIYFHLEKMPYFLRTLKHRDIYHPVDVYHKTNERCGYCGIKRFDKRCPSLDAETLFYQLIEHPSIRLEWLYLPYKGRVK